MRVQFNFDLKKFPDMRFEKGVQVGFLAQEVESVLLHAGPEDAALRGRDGARDSGSDSDSRDR